MGKRRHTECPFGVKIVAWVSIIGDILALAAVCVVAVLLTICETPGQSHLTHNDKLIQILANHPLQLICGLVLVCITASLAVAIFLLRGKLWAYYLTVALMALSAANETIGFVPVMSHRNIQINLGFSITLLLLCLMLCSYKSFFAYAKSQAKHRRR